MEKRVLLAIFLVFVFLFAYQSFVVRRMPAPAGQPAASGQPAGGGGRGPATGVPAGSGAAAGTQAAVGQPAVQQQASAPAEQPAPTVAAAGERKIVVETQVLRVVFSNRGGHAERWELPRYQGDGGHAVNLVPGNGVSGAFRMFDVRVDDEEVTGRLKAALFASDAADVVDGHRRDVSVTFDYSDAGGLVAHKTFRFSPDSYVVHVSAEVRLGDRALNPTVQMGPGLGDMGVGAAGNSYMQPAAGIVHQDGKVRRIAVKDLGAQPVREGTYRYAGIDDHYFLAVVLPPRTARLEYSLVPVSAPNGKPFSYVEWGVRLAGRADDVRLYLGPKDFDVLAAVDRDMVRAINYGIFDWLAVPLLRALKGINNRVGNYGWSIIVLTVLINVVMFPLRHKSVVSMRRMQELQPQIKAIQERYGKLKTTDPARQKMNQELMELYKSRGVNPASGCVPMLLTIPIFIAFYSLLSQAIELRGAPFVFWIKDLSIHDPYYVTPILMGGAWLWQQAMTPSSADPMQQKMFLAMPVVFTVMFLWAPSGLAIYWFVNNLLGIVQQYATNAIVGPLKAGGAAANEKRKRTPAKQDGAGAK